MAINIHRNREEPPSEGIAMTATPPANRPEVEPGERTKELVANRPQVSSGEKTRDYGFATSSASDNHPYRYHLRLADSPYSRAVSSKPFRTAIN